MDSQTALSNLVLLLTDHDPGPLLEDEHAPAGHRADADAAQLYQEEQQQQVHPVRRLVEGGPAHAEGCG